MSIEKDKVVIEQLINPPNAVIVSHPDTKFCMFLEGEIIKNPEALKQYFVEQFEEWQKSII